ncbi:FadR/GntR family transcriptional regulator [Daejeonella sp. JGW-45]|uniref:FadR/GntR family transcriptional regulator n=1 Tax=Daejeonella sp. JGW-45 TaxID=3034148 RepID=UPI0023ED3BC0|nr:FadR/GntR family transcriptional regulator [Daejeonella sp. JGW-45]
MANTKNNGNIEKIDTTSLVDKVEKRIIEFLTLKNLKVGDSIPKELELTEALGVSRTVIREALLRLRMMGLIESKKKRGSVITSPDLISIIEKSMDPRILDNNTLKEIFEMRLALEIGIADLIIERVTPKDIKDLRMIVANDPPGTFDTMFLIEEEIKFHGKLYEITQNETLKKFQRLLLPVFNYVHLSGLLKKPARIKKYASHKELVDVIETGDAEALRNSMRNHLENHFSRLFDSD